MKSPKSPKAHTMGVDPVVEELKFRGIPLTVANWFAITFPEEPKPGWEGETPPPYDQLTDEPQDGQPGADDDPAVGQPALRPWGDRRTEVAADSNVHWVPASVALPDALRVSDGTVGDVGRT